MLATITLSALLAIATTASTIVIAPGYRAGSATAKVVSDILDECFSYRDVNAHRDYQLGSSEGNYGGITVKEYEKSIIRWFKDIWNGSGRKNLVGATTAGSTLANNRAFREARDTFNEATRYSPRASVFFIPDSAHYSGKKSVDLTGIPSDCVQYIHCNEAQELDLQDYDRCLKIHKGKRLFALLTHGTTMAEYSDPVLDVIELIKKHGFEERNVWIHIDGAMAGVNYYLLKNFIDVPNVPEYADFSSKFVK